MPKKVFVSGLFDLLHSGHIQFFKEASSFGDLYVAVGSDQTLYEIKGRAPIIFEEERLFMIKAVRYVKDADISRGSGLLDFLDVLQRVQPDIFIVNEDGNIPEKQALCEELGIEYKVLKREPQKGLTARSSAAMRSINIIPYRIDIAGGWLDQPFVSKLYPGAVITISLEPTIEFNERSGMATSTRRRAIELWGGRLPIGDPETVAKMLFCYDNPPGTHTISGSQDAIGIVMPGLNYSYYEGDYWPSRIESVQDEAIIQFVEQSFYLIPLGLRVDGYDVLSGTNIAPQLARQFSEATDRCWNAIKAQDRQGFGRSMREAFEAQTAMFPNMITPTVRSLIQKYRDRAYGWKLSGAGGGGYLILVAEEPIEQAVRVVARRSE